MKSIPLIRTSNLFPFIYFLDQVGTPVDKLLRELHLPKNNIFNPLAICTETQMWNFIDKSSKLEGIKNLGILVAQESTIDDLGIFGQILLQSITLKDCLYNFINFIAKHHSHGHQRFRLRTNKGKTYFCTQDPYNLKAVGSFQAAGYSLIFMLNILKAYLGNQWKPTCIYLQDSNKQIWDNCECFSDIDLYFEHEFYAIVFPSYFLSTVKTDYYSLIYNSEFANWSSFENPENLSKCISILLESTIGDRIFYLDQIAEIIGKSKRTINRLLQKEGTTYKTILTETRYKMAVQKLANTSVPIAEIAYDLGYSDPAHFTNAFKRWSGSSPLQFRQQAQYISID
jgi:AraC-like DNA-binding protein